MTVRRGVFVALGACLLLLASLSPAPALLPGQWSVPAPLRGDPNRPYLQDPINENGFQWALAPAGGTGILGNLFALRLEVPGNLITLGNLSVPFSYGIAGVQLPAGTKVSDIKKLKVDTYYEQSTAGGGTCGGGSPRYQLLVDANKNGKADANDRNIFVYVGAYPNFDNCAFGVWTSNNLRDGALRWDSTQLGGPFYGNQATAAADAAGRDVLFVTLVWDSWWKFAGRTIFWADNLIVNQFKLAEPGLSHVCSLLKGQGAPGCNL
jgi:hypothetical protein